MRSALLAADLVLVPAQPSPFDGWASGEMLHLIREARIFRPELRARFVLNRCAARTIIARETADALAEHDPPVLAARIGQRIAFADAARTGRLVFEVESGGAAAREIMALAAEIEGLRAMTGRNPKRGFVTRPTDPDAWIRAPEPPAEREWRSGLYRAADHRCHAGTAGAHQNHRLPARHHGCRHAA